MPKADYKKRELYVPIFGNMLYQPENQPASKDNHNLINYYFGKKQRNNTKEKGKKCRSPHEILLNALFASEKLSASPNELDNPEPLAWVKLLQLEELV